MLSFRHALSNDAELYFKWANDALVRRNSLNTKEIKLAHHMVWFNEKIKNPHVFMYLFLNTHNVPVGQVIIEQKENWASVGQSIAQEHRGKKYSTEMLSRSTDDFLSKFPKKTIVSVVKSSNIASLKMSRNSGFTIVPPDGKNNNSLVLKGNQQNDDHYIMKSKLLFDL